MACTWTFASGNRRFVLFPPDQRQCSLRRCPAAIRGGTSRTRPARCPGRLWCSYCGKNHAGGKGECFAQVGVQTMKEQKTLDARNNKGLGRTVLLRDGRVRSRE